VKGNISMGTWEHIKLEEIPRHNSLRRNISMGTHKIGNMGTHKIGGAPST
jgi:hypothetical protein